LKSPKQTDKFHTVLVPKPYYYPCEGTDKGHRQKKYITTTNKNHLLNCKYLLIAQI